MITVTNIYRRKHPILSGVCEMINAALEENPNMSLAEFAAELDKEVMDRTSQYLTAVIKKQMEERKDGK